MSHAIAHDHSLTEASEQSNRAFFGLFVFSLVLVSIPIKNFAYVLPPLYLLAQLMWFDTPTAVRTLLLVTFVTVVSCISLFVDTLRGQAINLPGVLVGILTLLPLFMIVGERFNRRIDDALFRRISQIVAWYVILQAGIGTLQFAISRNSDAVGGTLGLLDFYAGSITIAQLHFGFLMLSMVLFLMVAPDTWLARVAIVSGLAISALSQSGHQSVFFISTLCLFGVLQAKKFRTSVGIGSGLVVMTALVLYFYPTTLTTAKSWYENTVERPDSPKRLAADGARTILSDPKNLVLGTGIGQYSSRAALITSGEFLRVRLPSLVTAKSDYFHKHMVPGLVSFERRGEGSAISKPYFTWLTVLVEFGLLQSIALAALIFLVLGRCFRMMRDPVAAIARVGLFGGAQVVFFLLCCGVENYAEFPQAIFVPFLLWVAAFSCYESPSTSRASLPL